MTFPVTIPMIPRAIVRRAARAALLLLAVAMPLAAPLPAQPVSKDAPRRSTLDRAAAPRVGDAPRLRVPAWTTTTLSNGARLCQIGYGLFIASILFSWFGAFFRAGARGGTLIG